MRRLWDLQQHKERQGEVFKPVAIAAGYFHTLVVVERGSSSSSSSSSGGGGGGGGSQQPWHTLYGFGDNSFAQLGCILSCNDDLQLPECKYMCPSTHPESMVVRTASELMAFTPASVASAAVLVRVDAIVAGAQHSMLLTRPCLGCASRARALKWRCGEARQCRCAMRQEGKGVCVAGDAAVLVWGSNIRGQLGDGGGGHRWGQREFPVVLTEGAHLPRATAASPPPPASLRQGSSGGADVTTEAGAGDRVVQIATGHSHCMALTRAGKVLVWGSNYFGQLGLGDRRIRQRPTSLPRFESRRATRIAAGAYHSAAAVACGQGPGWRPGSCDCAWGHKGYDCGVRCKGPAEAPCSRRGTFDREFRLGNRVRDAAYDCEPDGSCVCVKGYQGQACEIECRPTEDFLYQKPLAQRFVCECAEGWMGLYCNKQDPAYSKNTSLVMGTSAAAERARGGLGGRRGVAWFGVVAMGLLLQGAAVRVR